MLTEEELEVFARMARALEDVIAPLECIATHFEKEDVRQEQERAEQEKRHAESWENVRHQPIEVQAEPSTCIFCRSKARRVTRGPLILGCVACFSGAWQDI